MRSVPAEIGKPQWDLLSVQPSYNSSICARGGHSQVRLTAFNPVIADAAMGSSSQARDNAGSWQVVRVLTLGCWAIGCNPEPAPEMSQVCTRKSADRRHAPDCPQARWMPLEGSWVID